MSGLNPDATRTAQSTATDTQALIGLLGGLMPLLLQLQSQSPPQGYGGGFAQGDPGPWSGTHTVPNPQLDHQAAVEMVEDMNASALCALSTYLEAYAIQHTGLADCVAIVTQAARSFAMRDHAQTFALIWQAYRAIAFARAQDPQMPPPRVVGQGPQASPSAAILH